MDPFAWQPVQPEERLEVDLHPPPPPSSISPSPLAPPPLLFAPPAPVFKISAAFFHPPQNSAPFPPPDPPPPPPRAGGVHASTGAPARLPCCQSLSSAREQTAAAGAGGSNPLRPTPPHPLRGARKTQTGKGSTGTSRDTCAGGKEELLLVYFIFVCISFFKREGRSNLSAALRREAGRRERGRGEMMVMLSSRICLD